MPFKSKAQQRLIFAKVKSGEISKDKAMEMAKETKCFKCLPEKVAASFHDEFNKRAALPGYGIFKKLLGPYVERFVARDAAKVVSSGATQWIKKNPVTSAVAGAGAAAIPVGMMNQQMKMKEQDLELRRVKQLLLQKGIIAPKEIRNPYDDPRGRLRRSLVRAGTGVAVAASGGMAAPFAVPIGMAAATGVDSVQDAVYKEVEDDS